MFNAIPETGSPTGVAAAAPPAEVHLIDPLSPGSLSKEHRRAEEDSEDGNRREQRDQQRGV